MKRANILDPIHKELDQRVFSGITPRPRVVKFISDEMRKVLTPLLGFDPMEFMDIYLTGSLTTYQYSDTSDCDVSVFIHYDLWPTGEAPESIRRAFIPIMVDKLDGTMLPGTEHPIQHFVVAAGIEPDDLYKPGVRSAWSFRDAKWLVPPERDRVHDVQTEFATLFFRAKLVEEKMDELLKYNPVYAKEYWHQIHWKRQKDQRAGKGDFSESNIEYKLLFNDGYFDRIRDELGEKISKTATGLPGENYVPPIGSVWTMSNPSAGATPATRDQPHRQTVQVIDADDDMVWYKDLDRQQGLDRADGMSLNRWNNLMYRQIIRMRNQDWQLQQTPEEGAEEWPDTLPDTWSFVKEAETQRLFLAFELPPQIVDQVMQWQQATMPEGVHPEPATNLHMTIAFLGDTDTSMIPALQQVIAQIDPTTITLSGPIEYRELEKLAFLALQDQGGNEIVERLNEGLQQLMGYEPKFRPWLPHITVWRFAPENKPNLQPQLPNFGSFSPLAVNVYTSVKNPAGGGTYQKVADDLSWVDKSTPYGTPDGGFIGGPSPQDGSMEMPKSLPPRDDQSPSRAPLKIIYDFDRDQIILGDIKTAEQFPPGQIIGEYHAPDVILNDHADAWFNPGYFKRLWVHSFPKREIRHVILDRENGSREVVHRHPESAILEDHEGHEGNQAQLEAAPHEEHRQEAQAAVRQPQAALEYRWPEWDDIDFLSKEAVDNHQGYRDPDAIIGAVGNVQMANKYGAHQDIFDVAADLLFKIQRQQAAVEGNKRTAAAVALHFLEEHGVDTQPLDTNFEQLADIIVNLDRGTTVEQLAQFFRETLSDGTT